MCISHTSDRRLFCRSRTYFYFCTRKSSPPYVFLRISRECMFLVYNFFLFPHRLTIVFGTHVLSLSYVLHRNMLIPFFSSSFFFNLTFPLSSPFLIYVWIPLCFFLSMLCFPPHLRLVSPSHSIFLSIFLPFFFFFFFSIFFIFLICVGEEFSGLEFQSRPTRFHGSCKRLYEFDFFRNF